MTATTAPTSANALLKDGGAPTLSLAAGNPTPAAFLEEKFTALRELLAAGLLDTAAGRREATRYDPFLFALVYLPHYLVLDPTLSDERRAALPYGGITLCQFHVDTYLAIEEWAFPSTITRADRDAFVAPRESAKALALDTPVLTANRGWALHGELTTQDSVFTPSGRPARVLATRHFTDRPCYRVHFSDGTSIVADVDHEWVVHDLYAAANPRTVTTQTLSEKYLLGRRDGYDVLRYSLDAPRPVRYPALPDPVISPYVLGAWLGDGTSAAGVITVGRQDHDDLVRQLVAEGENPVSHARPSGYTLNLGKPVLDRCPRGHQLVVVGPDSAPYRLGRHEPCAECIRQHGRKEKKLQPVINEPLLRRLRRAGLLNNKHVPQAYLRASVAQRLALLQGLMDTDGTVSTGGACTFTTTTSALATGALALIRSLGIKATMTEKAATLNGRYISQCWNIRFHTTLPVFRLPRKVARLPHTVGTRGTRRRITAVIAEHNQNTNCIQVDSPDRQYLAGEALVPTHNSTMLFTIGPLWAGAHGHQRFIAAFSDSDDQVQKHLAKFHENLDNNPALKEDFPELCRPARRANGNAVNDNKNEFVSESGFTFSAHTVDGKIVGLVSHENLRPTLLILDDVEPTEDKYSATLKAKGVRRLADKILYLNEKARVVLVGTVTMAGSIMHDVVQSVLNPGQEPAPFPAPAPPGNPYRKGALVATWIKEQNFTGHYYPALYIDADTGALRSLWPEKWPVAELMPRLGTNDFMKNMQNNPVGSGEYWESGDITYTAGLSGVTRTILSIDPAVTVSDTSDYTGLAVLRHQPGNPRAGLPAAEHPTNSVRSAPTPDRAELDRRAARRGRTLPRNPTAEQVSAFYAGLVTPTPTTEPGSHPATPTPDPTTPSSGPQERSRVEVAFATRVKMRPARLRAYVAQLLSDFPDIDMIYIETNQGQDFVVEPFADFPVRLLTITQSEPKDVRIARLAQYYKSLRPRVVHSGHFIPLEEEMYAYPQTAHDDTCDAVASGVNYFLYSKTRAAAKKRVRKAPRLARSESYVASDRDREWSTV